VRKKSYTAARVGRDHEVGGKKKKRFINRKESSAHRRLSKTLKDKKTRGKGGTRGNGLKIWGVNSRYPLRLENDEGS